jgi:putative heme transporter
MSEPSDASSVTRVRLSIGSALFVAVTFVAVTVTWNMLSAAHRTIGWVVASTVVALLLEPIVRALEHRLRRGLAIAVTVLGMLLVAGSVVAGVLTDLNLQVERLTEDLPAAAEAIEDDMRFGAAATDFELHTRVEEFVGELDERLAQRAAPEEALDTGPAYFVNVVLVIFFLVFGTRLGEAAMRQVADEERRERWAAVGVEAITRGQAYILRCVGLAVAVGLGTGVTAWALSLPAPVMLGVVMTAFALIPTIGVLLGALPVLLLSAGFNAGATTAVLAAGFLLVQVALAVIVYRYVDARTVRVGPAVVVIVALIGFEVYGLGGTFFGVALAVFGVAALEVATAVPREREGSLPAGGHERPT